MSRTAVICTIGPACQAPEKMSALIGAGMDVARLHCSYESQEQHAINIRCLRREAQRAGREMAVLLDVSGSKVRMGRFSADWVRLEAGAKFTLTGRKVTGNRSRAAINIPELIAVIEPGDTILLADGALELEAIAVNRREAHCKVLVGGRIKSGQAVHVPGKAAPIKVPTEKDYDDVRFGIREGVDCIAQSFATTAKEIRSLRRFIHRCGAQLPVIVKIERAEALANLDELIREADAVMVARGDLGLSVPMEELPFVQKDIIRRCNAAGKPVITATEMLFSW